MPTSMSADEFEDKLKQLGLSSNDTTEEPVASYDPSLQAAQQPSSAPAPQQSDISNTTPATDLMPSNILPGESPLGIHQESGANNGEFPDVKKSSSDSSEEEPSKPEEQEQPATQPAALPSPIQNQVDQAIQNPYIRQYLQQKYGFGPGLSDSDIKAAQQKANIGKGLVMAGEGLDQAGAGYAGVGRDREFFNQQNKAQEQPVADILQRRQGEAQNVQFGEQQIKLANQVESEDPTSQRSQVARQVYLPILQKLGFPQDALDSLQNASEDTIKAVVEKPAQYMEAAAARKLQADNLAQYRQDKLDLDKYRADTMAGQKQTQQDTKAQQFNRTEQDKVSKEINALGGNSRNALGLAGRTLVSADRATDILNMKTITPQDMNSVSADIAAIIGGQSTVSGTEHQQYSTLAQDFASGWQKLSSNPQDVNAPALKDHLKDVIAKMRDISSGVIDKNLAIVKSAHPDFVKNNPDYFENVAKTLAGNLGYQTANGGPQAPTATQAPAVAQQAPASTQPTAQTASVDDTDVQNYAKAHNITPDQALSIKKQRLGIQ